VGASGSRCIAGATEGPIDDFYGASAPSIQNELRPQRVTAGSILLMNIELDKLKDFAIVANREIFKFCRNRASCIFSTAVVCDVLTHFGMKSEPLRVTTGAFPDKGTGVILGSDGDGEKRPAAKPGHWKGHLVSLVEDQYLIDTTLDQINRRGSCKVGKPVVIYLPDTEWWEERPFSRDLRLTGVLPLLPGLSVRYSKYHRQNGWKSAPDFRPGIHKTAVARLIELNKWW
jgi:hypothetical protein